MVGKKLKDLREDNDLFQKDIAKLLHVCQQAYSKWENNTEIIPLKHLNTLCNFYNVSMDYILGFKKEKITKNILKINLLNKKEIGLKIKIIRNENNLTLRALAKELNTTSSTISAYETGKTLILTVFAYQICKKYKVSLDWLCGKTKDEKILV